IQPSIAQNLELRINWCKTKNSCGNGVAYDGRVTFNNDFVNLYRSSHGEELLVNRFAVVKRKIKWNAANRTGKLRYNVIQLLDSLNREVNLSIRRGEGTIQITGASDVDVVFTAVLVK
ncbi:MAG: hypothetical protein ACKO13_11870, partial [Cytophagales bacterium]